VGSREPNLEARRLLVASCDETRFGVRGANDLDDEFGITYGDRVGVYIEGNCVDVIETTTRDGRRERAAVIEAYDGRVLRIIDEAVFRRRRRRRRRAAS
jgi:hypothetical protein